MIRYPKRLKSSTFVRVKVFPMYGGMGVSTPSLHRESTDYIPRQYSKCMYEHLPNTLFNNTRGKLSCTQSANKIQRVHVHDYTKFFLRDLLNIQHMRKTYSEKKRATSGGTRTQILLSRLSAVHV